MNKLKKGVMARLLDYIAGRHKREFAVVIACILLSGISIVCLLYYVVSLEKKAELEEELQNIHYTRELEKVLSVECFHLNSSISRLRSLMMHLNYRLTWKTK